MRASKSGGARGCCQPPLQTSEEFLGWGFTTRHDAGSCRKRATALGGESPLCQPLRTVAVAVDEDSLLDMIRAHASIKAGVGGEGARNPLFGI